MPIGKYKRSIIFSVPVTLFFLHFCSDFDEIWHEHGPRDPNNRKILRSGYLGNGCHGDEKTLALVKSPGVVIGS